MGLSRDPMAPRACADVQKGRLHPQFSNSSVPARERAGWGLRARAQKIKDGQPSKTTQAKPRALLAHAESVHSARG